MLHAQLELNDWQRQGWLSQHEQLPDDGNPLDAQQIMGANEASGMQVPEKRGGPVSVSPLHSHHSARVTEPVHVTT